MHQPFTKVIKDLLKELIDRLAGFAIVTGAAANTIATTSIMAVADTTAADPTLDSTGSEVKHHQPLEGCSR